MIMDEAKLIQQKPDRIPTSYKNKKRTQKPIIKKFHSKKYNKNLHTWPKSAIFSHTRNSVKDKSNKKEKKNGEKNGTKSKSRGH